MRLLKGLTITFRILVVLALLVIIILNSSKLITVSDTASNIIVFIYLLCISLAMLFQTLWHKEDNSCRQNFAFKLSFVLLIFLTAVILLIIGLAT